MSVNSLANSTAHPSYVATPFVRRYYATDFFMEFLYPPDCYRVTLSGNPQDSLIDRLHGVDFLRFTEKRKGFVHSCALPVRFITRFFINALVLIPCSGASAVYHLGQSARFWHTRRVREIQIPRDNAAIEGLEKMRAQHLSASRMDLVACTGNIIFLRWMVTFCLATTQTSLQVNSLDDWSFVPFSFNEIDFVICGVALVFFHILVLGGATPAEYVPVQAYPDEERTGRILSLRLRNDLGLVERDGTPLRFSQEDCVVHPDLEQYLPGGEIANRKLKRLFFSLEWDLFRVIKGVKEEFRIPIRFAIPLNGDTAVRTAEEYIKSHTGDFSGNKLVVLRRRLQLIRNAQENLDYFKELFIMLYNYNLYHRFNRHVPLPDSFLTPDLLHGIDLQQRFNTPESNNLKNDLATCNLEAWNPAKLAPINLPVPVDYTNMTYTGETLTLKEKKALYAQFNQDVRVSRWYDIPRDDYRYLGFRNDEFSLSDLNQAYTKYFSVLQSIGEARKFESLELIKFLNAIKKSITSRKKW